MQLDALGNFNFLESQNIIQENLRPQVLVNNGLPFSPLKRQRPVEGDNPFNKRFKPLYKPKIDIKEFISTFEIGLHKILQTASAELKKQIMIILESNAYRGMDENGIFQIQNQISRICENESFSNVDKLTELGILFIIWILKKSSI